MRGQSALEGQIRRAEEMKGEIVRLRVAIMEWHIALEPFIPQAERQARFERWAAANKALGAIAEEL